MTSKLLNRRQARWAEFLSRFNFRITYRPGKQGGKPDSLTRRSGDRPDEGDPNFQNFSSVLKSHNVEPGMAPVEPESRPEMRLLASNSPSDGRDPLPGLFEQAYQTDKIPNQVLQALQRSDKRHPEITLAECENRSGLLYSATAFTSPPPTISGSTSCEHSTTPPPLATRVEQRPSNSSSAGTTGTPCDETWTVSCATVTLAAARGPPDTPPSASSDRSPSPRLHGRTSAWISLSASRGLTAATPFG